MNLTKEQKQMWIIENCMTKHGYIDLKGLSFKCNVDISFMKVDGTLEQDNQTVNNGKLLQNYQTVNNGSLHQDYQEVNNGSLYQDDQKVYRGSLWQSRQDVNSGILYQDEIKKREKDE